MVKISEFYGIKIYMYNKEHQPPHFHAKYSGYEAYFDTKGNKIKGRFPAKQMALVTAWVIIHQAEIISNWQLAEANKTLKKISPLK